MPVGKNKTGLDFLIKEVGTVLMPAEAGWEELLLYDRRLFNPKYSIEEVTSAVFKVLQNNLIEEIKELKSFKKSKTISNTNFLIPSLEKKGSTKRIILSNDRGIKITVSEVHPLFKDITFKYKNIEYIQSGSLGSIYFRIIGK